MSGFAVSRMRSATLPISMVPSESSDPEEAGGFQRGRSYRFERRQSGE